MSWGSKGHRPCTGQGRIFSSVAKTSGLRGLQTLGDSRGFWRQGCFALHGILLGARQTVGQVLIMSFKINNFW